jgi:AcrR family transcriptional regulator
MAKETQARMRSDERREQLLRAGAELLSERAYYEVSIDEIAAAAGVSKGLLYHYFPTKKDFLLAALERGQQQLAERMTFAGDLDPLSQFAAGLAGFLDHVEEQPRTYISIFRRGGGPDPEIAAVLESTRNMQLRILLEGMTRMPGTPTAGKGRAALEIAAQGWSFLVEGAVLRWLEHGGIEREELEDMLRRALFGVLLAAHEATQGKD